MVFVCFFTGRMPRNGKLPVLNLLTGQKSDFRPAGATRCTDSRQPWQGQRHLGPLGCAKFHINRRTGWESGPKNIYKKNPLFW